MSIHVMALVKYLMIKIGFEEKVKDCEYKKLQLKFTITIQHLGRK